MTPFNLAFCKWIIRPGSTHSKIVNRTSFGNPLQCGNAVGARLPKLDADNVKIYSKIMKVESNATQEKLNVEKPYIAIEY
jgi:hypothetical protein